MGGGGAGGAAETWSKETEKDTFEGQGAEASVLKYAGMELERESKEDHGGTGGKVAVGGKAGRKSEYKFDNGAMSADSVWAGERELGAKTGPAELGLKLGLERDASGEVKWELEGSGELDMGGFDGDLTRYFSALLKALAGARRFASLLQSSATIKAALGTATGELGQQLGAFADAVVARQAEVAEKAAQYDLGAETSTGIKVGYSSESDELEIAFLASAGLEKEGSALGIEAKNETKRSKAYKKLGPYKLSLGGSVTATAAPPPPSGNP